MCFNKKRRYANEDVITLTAENGNSIDFIELAGVLVKDDYYAILQPVELFDGMSEDEALVFRVTTDELNEDNYEIELDRNIINAVFGEFEKLYLNKK